MSTIQKYHHFDLIAYCILPDHIHLLITLADVDQDFSSRIKEIKRKTTVAIRDIKENPTLDVWQGRFWKHTIRDQDDLQHCFEMNPPRSKLRGINFVFYPC
jgi:putative transposase